MLQVQNIDLVATMPGDAYTYHLARTADAGTIVLRITAKSDDPDNGVTMRIPLAEARTFVNAMARLLDDPLID